MDEFKKIEVDVTCQWTEDPPVYRIYLDSDLITERTFSWPGYQNYIREHLICNLHYGIHKIKIENCSSHGHFEIKNFTYDGRTDRIHPNYIDPLKQEITFIVSK